MPGHPAGQGRLSARRFWLGGLVMWGLFLVLAVGQGVLRQTVTRPALGPETAHILHTVGLCVVLAVLAAAHVRRRPGYGVAVWLALGLAWAVLTMAFEACLGLGAGRSWRFVADQYRLAPDQLWGLVPLTLALAPASVRIIFFRR